MKKKRGPNAPPGEGKDWQTLDAIAAGCRNTRQIREYANIARPTAHVSRLEQYGLIEKGERVTYEEKDARGRILKRYGWEWSLTEKGKDEARLRREKHKRV